MGDPRIPADSHPTRKHRGLTQNRCSKGTRQQVGLKPRGQQQSSGSHQHRAAPDALFLCSSSSSARAHSPSQSKSANTTSHTWSESSTLATVLATCCMVTARERGQAVSATQSPGSVPSTGLGSFSQQQQALSPQIETLISQKPSSEVLGQAPTPLSFGARPSHYRPGVADQVNKTRANYECHFFTVFGKENRGCLGKTPHKAFSQFGFCAGCIQLHAGKPPGFNAIKYSFYNPKAIFLSQFQALLSYTNSCKEPSGYFMQVQGTAALVFPPSSAQKHTRSDASLSQLGFPPPALRGVSINQTLP